MSHDTRHASHFKRRNLHVTRVTSLVTRDRYLPPVFQPLHDEVIVAVIVAVIVIVIVIVVVIVSVHNDDHRPSSSLSPPLHNGDDDNRSVCNASTLSTAAATEW